MKPGYYLRKAAAGIAALASILLFQNRMSACTGISFTAKDGSHLLARSIEWASERLDSRYVVVPRGHSITSMTPDGKGGKQFVSRYGYVGVRVMSDELVVEGMNEKGLNAGLFFFPGYGSYQDFDPELRSSTLCDFQVVSWALASFSTVDEVVAALPSVRVTGLDKNVGAVHWRFGDRTGRQIVVEITGGKLNIYDNPVGVLTNAPGFEWHLTNLGNYLNLVQGNAGGEAWKSLSGTFPVKALSGGSGMLGLPGDPTSPSRFVRVAVYRATAPQPSDGFEAMLQSFKILEAMVIPVGVVIDVNANPEKSTDMLTSTQFTTASDIDGLKFYYRTMDNSRIRCINLEDIDFGKVKFRSCPLDERKEQVEILKIR
ncbi:MAG: linear amide C-N hydrolase [Candidatus Cryptobacteroides sp.]